MKKSQGRRKGPRLPGTLLKELGSSSGGGKGPGHRQTWKRTNEVKRRREDVGKPKKKRLSGSKFDELLPQSATAMGPGQERKKKKASVDTLLKDPEEILQRKLAKKLGLKSTRLNDGQDGLDDLLQEFDDVMAGEYSDASDSFDSQPSVSGSDLSVSLEEESSDDMEGDHESVDVSTKYVPPALRKRTGEDESILNTTNEQEMAVRKRVRGLINRVAEANLEGIVSYVFCIIVIDCYMCILIWHSTVQGFE